MLSLAASVAVAEALRDVAGIDARLKWPNDVLVGGRKIAGILLERHGDAVIVGVGINVSQRALPSELTSAATSVALEGGRTDREGVAPRRCAAAIGGWRDRLEHEGFAAVRARWSALAGMLGREVSVDGVTGIARGLDDDGALLIETAGGTERVLAGDVVEGVTALRRRR